MRILLATDFSSDAEIAQTLVMGMPLPAGSRIRVVHAVEPPTTAFAVMPLPTDMPGMPRMERATGEGWAFGTPLR